MYVDFPKMVPWDKRLTTFHISRALTHSATSHSDFFACSSGRTLQGMVYKFPLMKTNEEKEQEKDLIASRQVISAKQQSRVKEVTQDLVDWGAQLVRFIENYVITVLLESPQKYVDFNSHAHSYHIILPTITTPICRTRTLL